MLFLTPTGRYRGRLASERTADLGRLMMQVDQSRDPEFVLKMAKTLVAAKLHDGRILLRRLNRSRKSETVTEAIAQGTVFAPMHWGALWAIQADLYAMTLAAACPTSKQPELKACSVHLSSSSAPE